MVTYDHKILIFSVYNYSIKNPLIQYFNVKLVTTSHFFNHTKKLFKKVKKDMANKNVSKVKVVFLGDQSVGKTSLLHRFMYDTFDSDHNVRAKKKLKTN